VKARRNEENGTYELEVEQGGARYDLTASCVVNATGIDAPNVYNSLMGGKEAR